MRRWWRFRRFARLKFMLRDASLDVIVTAQVGPTRWGPFRAALTSEERDRIEGDVKKIVRAVQTSAHLAGQAEAIIEILPPKEER